MSPDPALLEGARRKNDNLFTMYDSVQTGPVAGSYRSSMMRLLADLMLVLSCNPGKACKESDVMMARVRRSGLFELLSAAAWARALGYAPDELTGKSLSELMPLEKPAAGRVVAALLDDEDAQPLDVTLRCKDERRKCFRFHRRFDAYQDATYVVADELPEGHRVAPRPAYG
jgi:hypothetical protein